MVLSKEQIDEIEVIERATCHFFDVNVGGIYEKTSRRSESLARAFIFYILHEDMNISTGCIGARYGRKRNAIFKSLAKIKYRVSKMHAYKEMYLGICNAKKDIIFA